MIAKVILINLIINLIAIAHGRREKRYLVYPDGGPARAQFIIGLGIPVDLKEASVTVGTVIKFQYDLPTNSSEYTTRFYGFVNTVSRDMDDDNAIGVKKEINENGDEKTGDARKTDSNNEIAKIDDDDDKDDDVSNENNTLVEVTFGERKKRSLYTEGGVIDVSSIDEIPTGRLSLQEAIRRQEEIDKNALKDEKDEEEPQRMNRWDFYKVLESMVERYGYTGRPCLLRTICEAAEVPFTHDNGLLGEIAHILFTPSTTRDSLSHHTDNEYHAAERLGRETGFDCETLFPECEGSILDTFTHIGIDTLHKFGLY